MSVDAGIGECREIDRGGDPLTDSLPPELVGREAQQRLLATTAGSGDAVLVGPPGAGKTTLGRMALAELDGSVTATVNCSSNSRASALHDIARQVGVGAGLSPRPSPATASLSKIRDLGESVVVLLDDVDRLSSFDLLYDMYQIPTVSVIATARSERALLDGADDQTASRVRAATTIDMPAYARDELVSILRDRAQRAGVDELLVEGILDNMAVLASGDARQAIALLRATVERVRAGLCEEIDDEAVAACTWTVTKEVVEAAYSRLDRGARAVADVIAAPGEVSAAEVDDLLDADVSARTRQRWLGELLETHPPLVEKIGKGPSTVYRGHQYLDSVVE